MMNNVSNLVGVKWYLGTFSRFYVNFPLTNAFILTLGVPFNDTQNWRLSIAENGQRILGDNLLGLQAGNEPDLYSTFVQLFSLFITI